MTQPAYVHEFVDVMPTELEERTLYVSIRYRTAAHLCACGCGAKVVTPIKPAKWHLYFDGDTVSLWPSVGRWQLPCRSHYWLENGEVRWSKPWTQEEVDEGRRRDTEALRRYYEARDNDAATTAPLAATQRGRWYTRLRSLLRR